PYVTFGVVITRNPVNSARNVGIYRLQKFSNITTGMHWHKHHDGARHFEESRRAAISGDQSASSAVHSEPPNYGTYEAGAPVQKSGHRLGVAVVFGAPPAVTYAASAPLPPDIDEMVFAGFLRREPVRMVKCKTIDLEVPAHAEII